MTEEEGAKIYGGSSGHGSEYLKLVSSDGHEMLIKEQHAIVSRYIKDKLQTRKTLGAEEENVLYLEDIPSHLLLRVCQYFTFKAYYTANRRKNVPKFVIEDNMLGDMLQVANVLKC